MPIGVLSSYNCILITVINLMTIILLHIYLLVKHTMTIWILLEKVK